MTKKLTEEQRKFWDHIQDKRYIPPKARERRKRIYETRKRHNVAMKAIARPRVVKTLPKHLMNRHSGTFVLPN